MDQGSQPLGAGHSKMVERSAELLMNPISFGEPMFDKVFIAGKISQRGSHWRLDVMDDYPVVALDDEVRQEFGLVNCPTVAELRDQEVGELSLISGGSFLWVEQDDISSLILFKRDQLANTDKGLLTGAAGRCSGKMWATIIEETNEELIIIKSGLSGCKLLGFCQGGSSEMDAVADFKFRQVVKKRSDLATKGRTADAALLRTIRSPEDVEIVPANPIISKIQSDSVSFYIEGKQIERVDNCLVYLDDKSNTLEVRQIVSVKLEKGEVLAGIWDGELFNREIVIVSSLNEISEDSAVPALKNYMRKAASVVRLE